MISEQDVIDAIPKQGFIFDYINHCALNTTAPIGYHLATGLNILSATCPASYSVHYAGEMNANLFSMCVGRSGEDQKTTAVKMGRKLLYKVDPDLLSDKPVSSEGMLKILEENPQRLLIFEEMGEFMSKAQTGYFEPIKSLLTDLWDCTPQSRRKANEVMRIDEPRLSCLAAISIPYLEKYTNPEDWTGGFLGRWFIIYSKRERTDPFPSGNLSMLNYLIETLQYKNRFKQKEYLPLVGKCRGLDKNAMKLWVKWFNDLDDVQMPDKISGAKTRAPAIAIKIALLYAWDFGLPVANNGGDWYLDAPVIAYAIAAANLHINSVCGLSDRIAEHPEALQRRSILDFIPVGTSITLGQLIRATKLKKKTLIDQIDGLVIDGTLSRTIIGNSHDYVFTRESE